MATSSGQKQGEKRTFDEMNNASPDQSGFQRFFNSKELSDITVISGSQTFHAHKVILSAQCDYFASVSSGPWKELQTNKITLKGDPPGMVEAILLFIYQLDPYSTPIEVSPTLFSVMLYVANDKYMIPKLKVLAKETTATLLRGTKVHEDFPSVISEFYHTTREDDRALRDLILLTSHRHLDALKLNKNFQKVLRETRDFASDLVLLQRGYGLDSFSCKSGYCKAVWWLMPGASSSYRYCPHCRSSIAKS